jgi:hypothetical protein
MRWANLLIPSVLFVYIFSLGKDLSRTPLQTGRFCYVTRKKLLHRDEKIATSRSSNFTLGMNVALRVKNRLHNSAQKTFAE